MTGSFSVILSTSASLNVADIVKLAAMPNFSVFPGQPITAADTGANLLTVTTTQKNMGVALFKVSVDSTVTVADALSLVALPQFGVLSGIKLTVAGPVSQMTSSPVAASLPGLAAVSGIVVSVSDTLTNLLANTSAITTLTSSVPALIATMTNSQVVAVSDLAAVQALPAFRVQAGQTLTVADTVANLAAMTTQQTAVVQATKLSQADTATVQQLVKLLALPVFTKSVDQPLTVVDTLANIGAVTSAGRAAASAIVVADSLVHLLAASSLPTGVTGVQVLLDDNAYSVAQGAALLTLLGQGKTLTLTASGDATDLKIQDTLAHLTSAQNTLSALAAAGEIAVLPTDANGTFTASVAASLSGVPGFDPADYTISVADTGSALSAVANQVFGHGFATITVTNGKFSGTLTHLMDPALRFMPAQTSGNNPPAAATAELSADATIDVSQAMVLSRLPGFAVASGATLTVSDTMANLVAAAGAIGTVATDVMVTDTDVLSAHEATVLAHLRDAMEDGHFYLGGNFLIVDDIASELADQAHADGLALASAVRLSDDSIINAAEAMQLAALGSKFELNGFTIAIFDTVAHLTALAQSSDGAAVVNAWGGPVLLSANATLNLAGMQALATLDGLTNGARRVTISDTAANLIAGESSPVLHGDVAIKLSADATVSVADMAKLSMMPTLSLDGHTLVVRDTPEHLALLAPFAAQRATAVEVVAKTLGNADAFTIDAAELRLLANLPHLSTASLIDTIVVSDTAFALVGVASFFSGASTNPLRGHVTLSLSDDGVLDVAAASALAATGSVSLDGHALQVLDRPSALLSSGATEALALATQVGLNSTSSLPVDDAATLVALPNYTDGPHGLTISDTPAHLMTLAESVVAHSSIQMVQPQTSSNAADYRLDAADVMTLAALPGLSFADFSGVITVEDTAANLAALADTFADADPGSELLMIRAASHIQLSANAVVTVADLGSLRGLPGFNLHGHTLVLADDPMHLLSISPQGAAPAGSVRLADSQTAWTVSAADAAHLAAFPSFSVGNAGMRVEDSAQNILIPQHGAGVSAASSVMLDGNAVVSAVAATFLYNLPDFDLGSHTLAIRDTATAIAALDPDVAAMATSVEVLGGAPMTVELFVELRDVNDLDPGFGGFMVSDTAEHLLSLVGSDVSLLGETILSTAATVTAHDAADLATLPHFNHGDRSLTVTDTAAHLLQTTGQSQTPDNWAGLMMATQVRLSQDATITMAQARTLGELGLRFVNGGHALIIQDVPSQLQSTDGSSVLPGQVTGISLADANEPWVVTAATAAKLATLAGFDDGPGMAVVDTVGNLLAPANAAGLAAAVSVAPAGNITVTVANASALQQIPDFSLGGHTMTISDGGGKLATLDSNTIALASTIKLGGSSLVTVAQFDILRGLPNFSTDGRLMVINDTATNLLGLSEDDVALASMIVVSGNASLTAAQADALAELPRFSTGIARLTVLDTAANLLHISGNADLPDNWEGEMLAYSVLLTADATITAEQAADLATLGARFSRDGHTLTISDTPQALLASINAAGLAVATAIMLSANDVTITAQQAARLDAITQFDKGETVVTVSDTAANLTSAGYAPGIAMADHVQLSAPATLSVAMAAGLIGTPNFQVNANAALTIRDSLDDLLRLGDITLQNNDSILDTTRIVLAADVEATAAELMALRDLPQYSLTGATFSRDGHALVLADTGSDIAAFSPDSIAAPTAYRMVGDDTLSATEADILASFSTDLDGNRLTLADNPTALLDSGHASGRSLATAITLAGDTVTTASTATSLFANQKFSTGGHDLVVEDTAQALLGLSADVKIDVTMLALVASQSVNAATLRSLSDLGILFDLNGHTLTVVDSAANLAGLNEQELALVSAQLLNTNAVVNAATLEAMAALPDFALPDGVTLTVRDSVAALLGLSSDAVAISSSQELPTSSSVVVSAAEAGALDDLPNFSAPGSTIVVRDSIAHLNATQNAGWQDVATRYEVFDSIGNIIAHASSGLLAGAYVVTPSGDSTIDAATAGVLAGLPDFDKSDLVVVVVDGPAQIAAYAEEILAVATGVRINITTPITAAEAQALAALDDAELLSFSSGQHLAITDTFAHLSDSANAEGRALATAIVIPDTVANLLQAASANWGTVHPVFRLIADGEITGAQATVLNALGADFVLNDHTLEVIDNAAGAAGNVAAIQALDLMVQVTDTAANIGTAVSGLQDLLDDDLLTSIEVTNPENLTAAAAALLFPLRSVLVGDPITVVGTVASVVANFNGLDNWVSTLASVHVTDTAANVAAGTSGNPALQTLDTVLIVTLTGSTTLTASVAAGLAPVVSSLASGTEVDVTDTGASVAGVGGTLASLGAVLGTVTVTDSLTITADLVSGLSEVRSHFDTGVQFAIVDTAAHVSAAITPIGAMLSADRISAVTVDDETVASVLTHGTNLTTAAADVSILDTADHVRAQMSGLAAFMTGGGALTGITLTDSGTPTIELALSQFSGNEMVMEAIDSPVNLVISDFATNIQADLVANNSRILAHLDIIDVVQVADDETITLTVAQITATGVDDGAGSALSKLSLGDILVTGAAVANIDTLVTLGVVPDAIEVSDTAANIQADLASGGSDLLANRALITVVAVSDAGAITLTSARVQTVHVNDGAGSVLSKLSGGSLIVTGVSVADVDTVFGLAVAPASITVSDTAANLATDLALGASSDILGNLDDITGILNDDAGAITLTAAQVLFAGVNDGSGSALSKVTDGTLIVTGVTVAEIDTMIALGVPPASFTISDTASNIQADLISGTSDILANLGSITSITVSDAGLISLTKAEVELAGVNDGTGSVFDLMTGGTLRVTGLAVSEIDAAMALDVVPDSITVSDTAANIRSDIISGGSSDLLANRATIFSVTNSNAGAISLTEAQVTTANVNDGAGSILSKVSGGTLVVTGALAASVGTLADLPVAPASIAVSDSGLISLTKAEVELAGVNDGTGSVFDLMTGGTLRVTGLAVSDIDAAMALDVAPDSITVSDTAANIRADIISGGSSDLLANRATIFSITNSNAGAISLTEAQVTTANVNDGAGSILSKVSGGTLVVTGALAASVGTLAALPVAPASIAVNDTAANISTDLALGAGSHILGDLSLVSGITNSDAGAITLTAAQALFTGVNDGTGSAMSKVTGGTLEVTGATVAQVETIADLDVAPVSITVSDTAANIATDLALGGGSKLLADLGLLGTITNTNSGVLTLTAAQVLANGVNDGSGSVFSKLSSDDLAVTGATVAQIDALFAMGVPPDSFAISDTAAHIQADLISGTSDILERLASVTSIVVGDSGLISLTKAEVELAGVNDGTGSVFALMTGGTLRVTGLTVAEIDAAMALDVEPDSLTISDTAPHIAADIILGGSSDLMGNRTTVFSITNSDAGAISLTEAQVTTTNVNDGAGSILSKVTGGTLVVTNALVASIDSLLALSVAPASIALSDTAAHIQADLALGASSDILDDLSQISAITNSNAGVITLTAAQVLFAGVNDGAGSAMSKLTGGTLVVTGGTVAQIDTLIAMGFPPASFTISDTAAHIQADLISGSSDILANLGDITAITVSDAGLISLTKAQVELAGVNDGTGSAMDLMTGGTLRVTGLAVAEIDAAMALDVAPDSLSVSDTAANIRADIIAGGASDLMGNRTIIAGITNSNAGAISLTEAQVTATNVNDGAGSVLSKVTGGTLVVTDALVASIDTLLALPVAPASIALNDTAVNIQADVALGANSDILANLSQISGITNSNAGTITLTAAQLLFAGVDDGAGSVMAKLTGGSLVVTGVPVAQIDDLLALGVVPGTFAISDTAAHIQADLISGSSDILAILGAIDTITVSDAGVISLTKAQVEASSINDFGGSAMAKMTGGTLRVTGLTVAQIDAAMALGVPPDTITISDTAANIRADIIAGGASDLMANSTAIVSITNSDAGAISLTEAQVTAANVNDGAGSMLSKVSGGTLVVTAALAASVGTLADLPVAPASIAVTDTAANISTDLALGAGSQILGDLSLVSGITNSNAGAITLTAAQVLFAGVNDGAGSAMSKVTGGTLVVTGATVAQVEALGDLDVTPDSITVSDTAANIAADLALGAGSKLLAGLSLLSAITNSDAGAITLTAAQVLFTGVDDGGGSVISLVSGGTLVVTGVTVAQIDDMFALGSPPNSFTISDTAAHIQADLISGSSDILANLAACRTRDFRSNLATPVAVIELSVAP